MNQKCILLFEACNSGRNRPANFASTNFKPDLMKNLFLPILCALLCASVSCKDDSGDYPQPTPKITVTTDPVSGISGTSAVSGGTVSSSGYAEISARGVCWNTTGNPTLADSSTSDGTGTGSFVSTLTGLVPGTRYYVRAYAVQDAETVYGASVDFVAGLTPPTVATGAVTDITQNTATGSGRLVSAGDRPVTEAGLCWSVSENPTLGDDYTVEDVAADGSFTSQLVYLAANTTYYVRAYATSEAGTGYGEAIPFRTAEETPIEIPDDAFRTYLIEHYDSNRDGRLQTGEAQLVTEIDLQAVGGVHSLEGIKSFPNLRILRAGTTDAALIQAGQQNSIAQIDLGGMKNLEELWCVNAGISKIELNGCSSLHTFHGNGNQIGKIDVSSCTALREMHLNQNPLTVCDLSANTNLERIGLIQTQIARIDLSGKTKLNGVWCGAGVVESIDVSGCTALRDLLCETNRITSIDVTGCTQLTTLHVFNNPGLESVKGLETCSGLVVLHIYQTAVASLTLHNPSLVELFCHTCPNLTSLDVTQCPALDAIVASINPRLVSLDISRCAYVMRFLHLVENTVMESLVMKTGQTVTGDFFVPDYVHISYVD